MYAANPGQRTGVSKLETPIYSINRFAFQFDLQNDNNNGWHLLLNKLYNCMLTCRILSINVLFWKSYSTQKCIWPTFSLGSELSMYISIIDALRFFMVKWKKRKKKKTTIWGRKREREREKMKIKFVLISNCFPIENGLCGFASEMKFNYRNCSYYI